MERYESGFYDSVSDRAKICADVVSKIVGSIFQINAFVDIGCGSGAWTIKALENFGDAKRAVLIDLPSVNIGFELRDDPRVHFIGKNFNEDSEIPTMDFDLAFCTEVLEHIEEESALKVLDSIAKNCQILVFSGAVPGQGGTGHVNEQTQEYWDKQIQLRGFRPFDVFRPILYSQNIPQYYKNNLLLYIKPNRFGKDNLGELQRLLEVQFGTPRDYRRLFERIQHFFVKPIPWRMVTTISKFKKY